MKEEEIISYIKRAIVDIARKCNVKYDDILNAIKKL